MFNAKISAPLAEQMRPKDLKDIVGQDHIVKEQGVVARMLEAGKVSSMILWGPPGCGKTTLARIIAELSHYHFETISAVMSGTAELRHLFAEARKRQSFGKGTLILVDEIHRFNRSQQDVFLPYVEDGTIILVGATTENPSFELNAALLSRCKTIVLYRLEMKALEQLLQQAEQFTHKTLSLTPEARILLCHLADGDGRYLLSLCEELFALDRSDQLTEEALLALLPKRMPLYDKGRDSHYNLISALHKSLRGSDVDAALYWLARMLHGGETPHYILRRLVRFASEDIGLADPNALAQALAAREAYDFLGSPEGELALVQAVIYLATAPKSNAAYMAYKRVMKDAIATGSLMPPHHILNAPTALMKEQGYGKGYQYDHETEAGFSGQCYFPEGMSAKTYYQPVERGFERDIIKRLEYWQKLRRQLQESSGIKPT